MTVDNKQLSKLTSLLFSAAMDQNQWDEFLSYLTHVSGGVSSHIFGFDLNTNTNLGLTAYGYDPEFISSYEEYYYQLNPWAGGLINASVGTANCTDWMCPRERLIKTEFYQDWMLPQDKMLGGGGALLFKDQGRMFAVGGNIRSKDIDKLEEGWLDLIALLTPHLQQAFEINRVFAGQSLEKVAVSELRGSHNAAVVVINTCKHILHTNYAGQQLLEAGDIIKRDLRNRISLSDFRSSVLFENFIHLSIQPEHNFSTSFKIVDKQGNQIAVCHLALFETCDRNGFPMGHLLGSDEAYIIITISQDLPKRDISTVLMTRYKVTAHEAYVVHRVADGLTLMDISDERQVSIHTIRNQLKSAMSKMQVHRQVDLVRVVEGVKKTIT